MNIDDRKVRILQAIIHDYIRNGEPVGSRTIAKKYNLGVSSATIRNEMSDLEEMGYLEQLHSSSGRKPSDKGYRLYVDNLMQIPKMSPQQEVIIKNHLLNLAVYEMDRVIKDIAQYLSELTKLTCIVKGPSIKRSCLKHIQLTSIDCNNILMTIVTDSGIIKNAIIKSNMSVKQETLFKLCNLINDEFKYKNIEDLTLDVVFKLKREMDEDEQIFDCIIEVLYNTLKEIDVSEVYLGGTTNIFNYQEYNDIERARKFLGLLDDDKRIRKLLDRCINENDISIKIGTENYVEGAENCSIISAVYSSNDRPLGSIAIIGPTRMEYSKVVSVLGEVIKILNEGIIPR
ncbi:heat-inducible transcriptional repressor HrcA [Haloimpatiens sp. FM7330]|uniref:heat-inducible transcriptional repressor HrcA n=1 Tax=Haloimpatiens sp. FM7330 TaxID=3298610 RepID=UPI00362CD7C0